MPIDLRPKFKAPSVDDYSRGPSALVSGLQGGIQGFEQGQAKAQQLLEKKRRQDLAATVKDALGKNDKLKDLAPMVNEDTVEGLIPHIAPELAKAGEQDPLSEEKLRIQQQMADIAQQREDARGKNDELRFNQLNMMLQFQNKKLEDMNYQMEQNRLAGIAKTQGSQDLNSNKWNMSNLFKNWTGHGTQPDNITQKFQDLGGRLPPGAGSMQPKSFSSEAAAEKANLPKGTVVIINGRKAVVQ